MVITVLLLISIDITVFNQQRELTQLKNEISSLTTTKNSLISQLSLPRQTPPPNTPQPPTDFAQYSHIHPDFDFAHPKSWGTLTFTAESAGRLVGRFSANTELTILLHEKGITQIDGDDPTANLFAYKKEGQSYSLHYTFGEQQLKSSEIIKDSNTANKNCILYQTKGLGYYFGALGKLDGQKYDSVIFRNSQGRSDKPFTTEDEQVATLIKIMDTFESRNN